MIGTIHPAIVNVEIDSFPNWMIALFADEALQVVFLFQGLKYLPFNHLATLRTSFGEKLPKMILTIRLIVMFPKLIASERAGTFRAYEVVGVP